MSANNPNLTPIPWLDSARQQLFTTWLDSCATTFELDLNTLTLASADASFRRYFRLFSSKEPTKSYIIMDAPPDKENCDAFISVATLLKNAGLLVPEILHWSPDVGFMLITDLGTKTLMQHIGADLDLSIPYLTPPLKPFIQSIDSLVLLQHASTPGVLPAYDEALLSRELSLFPEWYLSKHKGISLSTEHQNTLDSSFKLIIKSNLSAPNVFVHRDFMTRNLMISADPDETRLGVLDFQDAVMGPITYDIASLMRDAFCTWSEEFVLDVTVRYWERIRSTGIIDGNGWSEDFGEFWRAVEWMGLQRHLKVAGIFARLTLRDHKPKYLADTPRFLNYIRNTAQRYRELFPLIKMIDVLEGTTHDQAFSFGRL